REQAYKLVEQARQTPSEENLDRLTQWRSQSPRHQTIMAAAQRLAQTIPQSQRHALNRRERIALFFDLLWARSERYAGTAGVALVSAFLVVWILVSDVFQEGQEEPVVAQLAEEWSYQTRYGQRREVALADGSQILLDWATKLTVRFTSDTRHVALAGGNAIFTVEPDASRPFTVAAAGVTTTVTGTEFAVRQYGQTVEVGVIEGSVAVSVDPASGQTVQLSAAEVVRANHGTLGEVSRRSAPDIGLWRDGVIVFRAEPFRDALAILSPYSRRAIDTSALNHAWLKPVSGTFFTDRADVAVISIAEAQGLKVHQDNNGTLVLAHRAPAH
ncbi:MAG: FecR domain-containing protein, partial [Pseudomonadota bacterium]